MSKLPSSCSVAPLGKSNHATALLDNATEQATTSATVCLIDLAMRVLARNQGNQSSNSTATSQLQAHATNPIGVVDALLKKSCVVAFAKGGNYATLSKKVKCDNCEHFMPDNIGNGTGIGTCGLGIESTQGSGGRLPLYRYADRRCTNFSKLMS